MIRSRRASGRLATGQHLVYGKDTPLANLYVSLLDAFGAAAQSLIGFFLGAGQIRYARRAAAIACLWGAGAGIALAIVMLASSGSVAAAFLPVEVHAIFSAAWFVYALAQPANALAFVTDGIHWGTSDYRFLRNAMILTTAAGLISFATADLIMPKGVDFASRQVMDGISMRIIRDYDINNDYAEMYDIYSAAKREPKSPYPSAGGCPNHKSYKS